MAGLHAYLARRGRRDGLDGLEGFDGFDGLPELEDDAFSTAGDSLSTGAPTTGCDEDSVHQERLSCQCKPHACRFFSCIIRPVVGLLQGPTDAAAEPDDGSLGVTPLAKMGVHSDFSCTGSGMATWQYV